MKAGRHTTLTPEVQETICKAVADGNTFLTSALAAGVAQSTFSLWMKRGEDETEGIYVEFMEAIKEASAQAVQKQVKNIIKAGKKNWQASAWFLERRHPQEWGKVERIEQKISGGDGGPIEIELVLTTPKSDAS